MNTQYPTMVNNLLISLFSMAPLFSYVKMDKYEQARFPFTINATKICFQLICDSFIALCINISCSLETLSLSSWLFVTLLKRLMVKI